MNQNLDLDTFYLTSFLLNYDIESKLVHKDIDKQENYVLPRLLDLITTNTRYPLELLLTKFFEYTICKKIELNQINQLLCDKLNLSNESDNPDDFANQFKEYFDIITVRTINFIPWDYASAYRKVNELITQSLVKLNNKNQCEHQGQPLPDPELGRPKLTWKYCQYSGCKKTFSSPAKLVEHLIKSNVYTRGFHSCHEDAVKLNNLTPEKVLENNITVCPSYICENKKFKKPEELIEHLQILGIKPFWQSGMELPSNHNKKKLPDIKSNQMYLVDSCLICLDAPVEIFINKCGHQVYCIDCLKRSSKTTCPICRTKVDMFLPYA